MKIVVIGGTSEGREALKILQSGNHEIVYCVLSQAGQQAVARLLSAFPLAKVEVRVGALCANTLAALVGNASCVVDASHPFATNISQLARTICSQQTTPYLRLKRAPVALQNNQDLLVAADHQNAAELAVSLAQSKQNGTIFLTIGSRSLNYYVGRARSHGIPIVARILPTPESLAASLGAGLVPAEIIALQGPTTTRLDNALIRFYNAQVMVSKESGTAGGLDCKIAAARAASIPMIVVSRPCSTNNVITLNSPSELPAALASIANITKLTEQG